MIEAHVAYRAIKVRGFKWPHRLQDVTVARFLGKDEFGRWLGVREGDPWWTADGAYGGVFETALIKVVPSGTFWTACFRPVDPLVDVDISLPVRWLHDTLEEVDLELDVLRLADGSVHVRDREEFDWVRDIWSMPDDIVARAEETCERVRELVEGSAEPFSTVGHACLARFMDETEGRRDVHHLGDGGQHESENE